MEIENWDGLQNCVMMGYILRAAAEWNRECPDKPIDKDTVDNLLRAVRWACDDMTAAEAYRYYITH